MVAKVLIILFATLCIAYSGLILFATFFANSLIFPAPPASYSDDADIFKLDISGGDRISAAYFKSDESQKLLLYSHGNGEDIGHIRNLLKDFQKRGISTLTYDYPGYGTSTGAPSEAVSYAAIEATYNYATKTLGYLPDQIVLYGRSLGSGPSTWLAQRKSVHSLILEGGFTSTFRVLIEVKLIPWDIFDNHSGLPHIDCPVLLIHGTEDRTVPFRHARKNWKAIQGPKSRLFVDGAGHNDLIEIAGPAYWDAVLSFIRKSG